MKKLEKMRAILAKKRSTIVRCLAAGYFLIAVLMMIILEDGRLPGFLMIGIGLCSYCIFEIIIGCIFEGKEKKSDSGGVQNEAFAPSPPSQRPRDSSYPKMPKLVPTLESIFESRELILNSV